MKAKVESEVDKLEKKFYKRFKKVADLVGEEPEMVDALIKLVDAAAKLGGAMVFEERKKEAHDGQDE